MNRDWEQSYRGVRCLVLGASGFIGRRVAQRLSAVGAEVFKAVRQRDEVPRTIECDLADESALARLFETVRPSITFNLSGYGVDRSELDSHTSRTMNAEVPARVCRAIATIADPHWRGLHLVHAGSVAEYGPLSGALTEEVRPVPNTVYGESKLAGTLAVQQVSREAGIRSAVARLFTVYGPGDHAGRLLPLLMETARSGRPLPLSSGEQLRSFTYVEDVAEGVLRLGVTRSPELVNISSGLLTPVRCFIETARTILNIHPGLLRFGSLPGSEWDMRIGAVSTEKMERLLGWRPATSIQEGIRNTAAAACDLVSCRQGDV